MKEHEQGEAAGCLRLSKRSFHVDELPRLGSSAVYSLQSSTWCDIFFA